MPDLQKKKFPRPAGRPKMIFRHDVLEAYPGNLLNDVPGVNFYGARVLAMSYPKDVVQMHPDLSDQKLLNKIIEHYDRVGLDVTSRFVFDESWEVAKDFPDHELNAFHFGTAANAVAPDEKFAQIADELNNKNRFIEFCHSNDTACPITVLFNSKEDFSTKNLPEYPVYVKGAVSASGMHVIRCEDENQLHLAVEKMPGEFQVQESLSADTKFCNIQYSVVAGHLRHEHLTLQKLSGNEHNGNIFPSGVDPDLIQPATDKLARILFEKGIKGTFAFDVAVSGGKSYLIEMNPRWNGASYYSGPAERLCAEEWEGQYVYPKHIDFDILFDDPIDWEYNHESGLGIVVINWGSILVKKLGLLVVGSASQRKFLLDLFQERFC